MFFTLTGLLFMSAGLYKNNFNNLLKLQQKLNKFSKADAAYFKVLNSNSTP